MNQDKIVKLFMDLASISSPSFHEKPVFDFIEGYLEGKPLTVKRFPYTAKNFNNSQSENMIIRLSATDTKKKGLFFDAHADTVPPCDHVVPVLDGDIIRSSGDSVLGADDKCGIASMLCALDEIIEKNIPHGELVFIISSAEEVGLVGAQYMPEEELKGLDYGIILDSGGSVGKINLKAPFHYEYHINITGRSAHAGMAPEQGINAILIAAQIIQDLPSGRISTDTVSNVAKIHGGIARNVVPDSVEIVGEFRSIVHTKCDPLKEQILAAVEKVRSQAVAIECTIEKSNDGYDFDENSPIIQFVAKAHKAIGIDPVFEESCGGTNANIYTTKGVASTVISVGMQDIHSVNEYIKIQDLIDTTRVILKMVELA